VAVFTKEFPSNHFVVDSSMEIGPTIGRSFSKMPHRGRHFFAGIIFYVAARFEASLRHAPRPWRPSMTYWRCWAHFNVLDKEITLLVVTALLRSRLFDDGYGRCV